MVGRPFDILTDRECCMARTSRQTIGSEAPPTRAAPLGSGPDRASWAVVVAAAAGMGAAWVAAGSVGLMAHPLRHILAMVLLAAAALACAAAYAATWRGRAIVLAALVVAAAMAASAQRPVGVLGAAVLLAGLAAAAADANRRALLSAALAVFVLGVVRQAVTAIPTLWLAADRLGLALGALGGAVAGKPLWVGATFAGVDFLVVTGVLCAAWIASPGPGRLGRSLCGVGGIVVGHLLYLAVVACAPDIQALLSEAPAEGAWSWLGDLKAAVPWSLPAVGAVVHLILAAVVLRRMRVPARARADAGARPGPAGLVGMILAVVARRWKRLALWAGAALLAAALPVVTVLTTRALSLQGKRIVIFERFYGNWERPRHGDYGRLSVGMYGMLPAHLECVGADWLISPDLAPADLEGADVLVLIYPEFNDRNEPMKQVPWQPGQLERIEQFVRKGGSLLVMGEHTTRDDSGDNRFNEALRPTNIRVRFDSAMFAVGGWLHSYEPLAHPATVGVGDDRNQFGAVTGASVEVRWPARPIVVGRWGWNDPGDVSRQPAMMGNHRYDAGEKLGDLVLAAEQPLGDGTVVAFGDTSGLTNNLMIDCHLFVHRLLGYLAAGPGGPQAMWRQVIGLLCAAALVALVAWRRSVAVLVPASLCLAASLTLCVAAAHRAGSGMLPDGKGLRLADIPRHRAASRALRGAATPLLAAGQAVAGAASAGEQGHMLPDVTERLLLQAAEPIRRDTALRDPPGVGRRNMLAYIDATHMPAYSEESLRPDGLMGLTLTLMRNGYLTLGLHEFTAERLSRAGLLILIAPRREFSPGERKIVQKFVSDGGVLICTVGYEDRGPSEALLADFGLYVGPKAVRDGKIPEPQPLGWFKSPFHDPQLRIGTMPFYNSVRFDAAWEVSRANPDPQDRDVLAYGRGNVPVIVRRRVGHGKVVLVGDTGFAMNKNLERIDGLPMEGIRLLGGMHVWNYNAVTDSGDLTGRGIKSLDVWVSQTGRGRPETRPGEWTRLADDLTLAKATGGEHYTGEYHRLSEYGQPARYVLFNDVKNWDGGTRTGLAEVRFFRAGRTRVVEAAGAWASSQDPPGSVARIHDGSGVDYGAHNTDPRLMWVSADQPAPTVTFDLGGVRENADFWRWLLAELTDQPRWVPPPPPGYIPPDEPAGAADSRPADRRTP